MNKMIKVAGLSLALLGTSMFANAAEAAQKVGYVNAAQVFQALPQREVVFKKLQTEFKDKADELKSIQAQAETKMQKLKRDHALMSNDEVEKLRIEIGQLESNYKIKGQAFEKMQRTREAQEKQKLFQKIQVAVKKVAEKDGYDVIVDAQSLLFAKPEYNISDEVIKQLK